MKLLFAVLGLLAVAISQAVVADKALADKLKPYEQFSPYKWTQWIESRPGRPLAAAAIAYVPQPQPPTHVHVDSTASTEEDEDDDDEYDSIDGVNAFENWFKRAILPQPPPTPVKKTKVLATTKKPSIVELPLDFWGPPPSIAPNVTLPPPPGYWAAKKSMFISKLFAALAASVLNETGAVAVDTTTTTTISPRQAILDELSEVLLSDVTRSVPPRPAPEDTTTEPEEFDDSDEDSEEEAAVLIPSKAKSATSTMNPFLLNQIDFLAKLTEAIASQSKATPAPVSKPKQAAPTTTSAPVNTKAGKKATKKSSKKIAKTPKYLKFIPTTTTPSPAPEVPEIDYNALAKAILGN